MSDLVEQYIKDCWADMVREINRLRAQLAERESTTPQPVKVPDVMEYGDSPFEKQMADGYWCRGWNACRQAMLEASGEGE